jgi:hypothetical protein
VLSTLPSQAEYCVIGSEGQFTSHMPYFSPIFSKRKEQQRIKTLVLARKTETRKKRTPQTQVRYYPSDVISPATINVYDGKVAIFIWKGTPKVILIKDADVSHTFKNLFKFMWLHSEK